MKLSSTAFAIGGSIPPRYTGVSQDVSPPLEWTDAPAGTKSFALICDDPDAPSRANPRPEGPWVHWVIYNIAADATGLPEALPRAAELPNLDSAQQGTNDFGNDNVGYRGPMPPKGSGPHRYYFRLYALDRRLDLSASAANKQSLLQAMDNHLLGQAELMGKFER